MPQLKELRFGEGLMLPTIAGQKRITLRKYRAGAHDFVEGEVVRGQFKDGLTILLRITADTEKRLVGELTDDEAWEDGFESAAHAFEGLKNFYPDLEKSDDLAIIRYEVLRVDDTPVVGMNG